MITVYGNVPSKTIKKDTKVIETKNYGFGYPLTSNRGAFYKQTGQSLIKNNLTQLIKTNRGERVMLPNFGMNLRRYLFEPLDQTTYTSIKNEILTAIGNYLPQLEVLKLTVVSSDTVSYEGLSGILVTLIAQERNSDQLVEVSTEVI